MNTVFIIPTGIGCAIGGHAGDATPAAKLIAQVCDRLILHPNVVNASDINEMPSNALYVEGSILDRFLEGCVELQEVKSNRILLVINKPAQADTVNAVNAARMTIGAKIEIVELDEPLWMKGWVEAGTASGAYTGAREMLDQILGFDFDALAIATPIDVANDDALDYFRGVGGVNPWGYIEAKVSRFIASALNKPVAHAPVESESTKGDEDLYQLLYREVIDPRKAAEICSNCYVHCILKGLHKAPRIGRGLHRDSIDCLITPTGVVGRPHYACFDAGIPVIAVEENKTAFKYRDDRIHYVDNYLEAAGVIAAIAAGVSPSSVRV